MKMNDGRQKGIGAYCEEAQGPILDLELWMMMMILNVMSPLV